MRNIVLVATLLACNAFAGDMGPTGGLGGTEFRDPNSRINSIKLCGGTKVDSITTTYDTGETIKHGGNGGTCAQIDFPASWNFPSPYPDPNNLHLVKITGCFNGSVISSMTLMRSDGHSITKGNCSGSPFSYGTEPHPWHGGLSGFFGRSGSLLDSIGVYSNGAAFSSYGPSGGKGGSPFELDINGAESITVCWGSKIDSIAMNHNGPQLPNVVTKVGGNGGDTCLTRSLVGNPIYSIRGFYTTSAVIHFTLSTAYGDMTFGYLNGKENFKYDGGGVAMRKFIGRSGSLVDAIGVGY